MKYLTPFLIVAVFHTFVNAQQHQNSNAKTNSIQNVISPHKYVVLKERNNGKRTNLYLNNTGTKSYTVFFAVNTDDYVLNDNTSKQFTIKPEEAVKVASMVLKDTITNGHYDYTLQVNDAPFEIDLKKDGRVFNSRINESFQGKDIVFYTKKDCDLCTDFKNILKRNRIKFKLHNFKKDSTAMVALIRSHKTYTPNEVFAPVIQIDDKLYTDIKTPKDLIMMIAGYIE